MLSAVFWLWVHVLARLVIAWLCWLVGWLVGYAATKPTRQMSLKKSAVTSIWALKRQPNAGTQKDNRY
jgi:hypothetical protein